MVPMTGERLLQLAPWVHAGLGTLCLISGLLALMSKKDRGRHPKAGRVFAVSLALTFAAILLNIIARKNVFMLGIGWLAVFAGIEGWRALLRFKGSLAPQPAVFDYTLGCITLLLSVGLCAFGVHVSITSETVMGLVCVGFGVLGFALLRGTWTRWRRPPPKPQWLKTHVDMMLGAFSAAVTAFLAIQLSGHVGGFEWVVWVAPTLLLSRYGSYEMTRRGPEPRR